MEKTSQEIEGNDDHNGRKDECQTNITEMENRKRKEKEEWKKIYENG